MSQVAGAERQAVDVCGGGDQRVRDFDPMGGTEMASIGAGLAPDAFIELDTMQDAPEMADDERLARAHAGSDLGDRDRCPAEHVTGGVAFP